MTLDDFFFYYSLHFRPNHVKLYPIYIDLEEIDLRNQTEKTGLV